jgi:hypothetical protein
MKLLTKFFLFGTTLFLCSLSIAAEENANIKYPINTPPSAELHYLVNANHRGFPLNGESDVKWKVSGSPRNQTYSISTETRADLFGKILEAGSVGEINDYGLAPIKYEEKSRKKKVIQTTFNRTDNIISFTESKETVPLYAGEQDRSSAVWQLVSIARGSPKKFTPKSKWSFFVAGRKNAEKWTFTVDKNVTIPTALGKVSTVHVTKSTSDPKDQRIEIWLAPSKEWYPVRIKSQDPDGDTIEQDLVSIN